MRLSNHFFLHEFTKSATAARHGLENRPSDEVIHNLRLLCQNVLEPLRQQLHSPIVVTSGYRSPEVNQRVGGARKSQHIRGEAADIVLPTPLMAQAYMYIRDCLPFDQLIMERTWIHVSYKHGHNRHQEVIIKEDEK